MNDYEEVEKAKDGRILLKLGRNPYWKNHRLGQCSICGKVGNLTQCYTCLEFICDCQITPNIRMVRCKKCTERITKESQQYLIYIEGET